MKNQNRIYKLLLGVALIAELVCFAPDIKAQVKIGDITMPDSIAKEYFLYCYQHPDTTWFYQYSTSKIEIEKAEKELNKKLLKAKTRLDSINIRFSVGEWSEMRMISNKESYLCEHNIGTVDKKEEIDGDITYYYTGYLTKHEPTAQDFSVWYIKRGAKSN